MAYLALYRKWRPQTFDEVVGQKHIALPLERAVEQDKLAHAYLFSGPRGTGKTTMAKILAKAVNCEHRNGPNPCNECRNCREITAGNSLDVYEIDAASNRGIDEIRALKESVRTLPVSCRKKVYIIDEVHMLSREAFNALLKTLEEPPSYVLFILATTEPERIPLTILSRCQRYEFHRISSEDIKKHLLYIASREQIPLTEDAAELIALRSDGGLRDALSLLDQCAGGFEGPELNAKVIYDMLGLTGKDEIVALFNDITQEKGGELLTRFYRILQDGREPDMVLRNLLEHVRNIMICKVNPKAQELSSYGNLLAELRKEAKDCSNSYLEALFESLQKALSQMKNSSSPRLSAEIELLHLTHIKGDASINGLNERISSLEKEVSELKKQLQEAASGKPAIPSPVFPPASSAKTVLSASPAASAIPSGTKRSGNSPAPVSEAKEPPDEQTKLQTEAKPSESSPSTSLPDQNITDPSQYPSIWKKFLDYLMSIHRIDMTNCFNKSQLILLTPSRAVASTSAKFLVQISNSRPYKEIAASAFQKILGHPVELHTVLKGSPEENDAKAKSASQRRQAPADTTRTKNQGNDFRKVSPDEIPSSDRENKVLRQALKIIPDCDIYEKD